MRRLSVRPNDRVRAIHDVLRLPDVRRIELGWGASVIGELAGQVTLVVYAFDAGGAVLVATYVASRTLLSMAVTLAITGFSGRVRPGSLLRRIMWFRAAFLVLAALTAVFLGLAALSLHGLAVPDRPRSAAKGAARVARDVAGGLTELAGIAAPGGAAILAFAQTFVRGALLVLIPVLAVDTLALGQSAVGWLTAAIGAGGLIGGAAATGLVRVTRLGRAFVAGLLLWGLPLVWLALTPSAAVAYLALVVVGVGNAVEDVGLFTLLVRSASPRSGGECSERLSS